MITAIVALSGACLLLVWALVYCIFIIHDLARDIRDRETELEPVYIIGADEQEE